MILVDTALQAREAACRPIRVAIVGAGFMSQGLAHQIAHSIPGMRLVAISNRNIRRAIDVFQYCGFENVAVAESQGRLDEAIRANRPVATEDALLMARSEFVDVLVDTTGSVEFGAHIVLEGVKHPKDVILL